MTQTSLDASSKERRLEAILAAHFVEADAGRAVDWRPLLAEHPDLAADLEAFFTRVGKLEGLVGESPIPPVPEERTPVTGSDRTPTHRLGGGDAPAFPSLPRLSLPMYFGDYELLEEIARGGMGIVYKARQTSLNRLVALKMVLGGPTASRDDLVRFRLEAEAAARLDHPNIVPIHEVGERDGFHFFSMKLVEGGNMAGHMARFQADPRLAARVLAQVARAVHYAHTRGILHRDLKPGNILLSGQWSVVSGQKRIDAPSSLTTDHWPLTTPYVTDFGLAKRLEVDAQLTQTGMIVGTPSYMPPEQALGQKDLDATADVYSLGAILYQVLTGRRPFEAETPLGIIAKLQSQEPERPSSIDRRIDRNLEAICMKCLEKRSKNRYVSAQSLAEDLERFLRGEPISVRGASVWRRAGKWAWRRRGLVATGYALVLVAVAAVVVAVIVRDYGQGVRDREKILEQQSEQYKRLRQKSDDEINKRIQEDAAQNPDE